VSPVDVCDVALYWGKVLEGSLIGYRKEGGLSLPPMGIVRSSRGEMGKGSGEQVNRWGKGGKHRGGG